MDTNPSEAPVTLGEGLRGIWRHVRPYRAKLGLLSVLGLVSAAANGAVPYVMGRFFDALIHLSNTGVGHAPLWALLLLVWACLQLLANSVDWVMDREGRKMETAVHLAVQRDGFVHLFRLPLSFHTNEHVNGVISKISTAGWRIASILQTAVQIAPQLLSVLIGITLAASISVPMAGILATGVLVYVLLLVYLLRPIAAIDHAAHESWNGAWDEAAAAVLQVPSVKQAAGEEYEIEKVRNNFSGKVYDLWYALMKTWSSVGFFQRIVVFLTQLAIFIGSVSLVARGTLTVGDLIALNGYALLFFGPFVALGHSWQTIQNGVTAAGQVERIFQRPEERYHPANAETPREHTGRVVFDNVSFRYEAEHAEVISNISFSANPGSVTAFVGESGGGKSTAAALISGYYFADSGTVSEDGLDTRRYDLIDLRRRIAVVPQEVALFNDTIRANIRYGSFEAPSEAVERAARDAHIHDFIATLPNGYDSLVGERGVKLSVGQKQRIAIARALLRSPEILILDEPTSALDAGTEHLIAQSLETLMRNRTTFIIAHRLSTVRHADLILVFKEGSVVERGSHEALMQIQGGLYRSLYERHVGSHA